MNLHDPVRPKHANGQRCWLDSTYPLPQLGLTSHSPGKWTVQFWLYDARENAALSHSADFHDLEVEGFLRRWERDPELCLWETFGKEPPKGSPQPLRGASQVVSGGSGPGPLIGGLGL